MPGQQIEIDAREIIVAAEWLTTVAATFRDVVKTELMAASLETVERVKREMPVDTGRARASWGSLAGVFQPGDGVWEVEDDGLTIIQGSNVEYIPALNEGHSKQAPAGFIDAAAEDLERSTLDKIEDGLSRLMS